MEIEGIEDLPVLFISAVENLMDEFEGLVKDFRGLFKIPSLRENKKLVSAKTLHQQICVTAKDQFEATKCECNLYGLDCTKEEQISNRITRAQGNYRSI